MAISASSTTTAGFSTPVAASRPGEEDNLQTELKIEIEKRRSSTFLGSQSFLFQFSEPQTVDDEINNGAGSMRDSKRQINVAQSELGDENAAQRGAHAAPCFPKRAIRRKWSIFLLRNPRFIILPMPYIQADMIPVRDACMPAGAASAQ